MPTLWIGFNFGIAQCWDDLGWGKTQISPIPQFPNSLSPHTIP